LKRCSTACERFVRERLCPLEAQVSETDQIPPDIVQEMRAMGLFGLTIPENSAAWS
jgi:acyl-CoA dehydrogenase